jgi:hypothetical protein
MLVNRYAGQALTTNEPVACRGLEPRPTNFEDSLPDVASRSFRRRGEVGRTTTMGGGDVLNCGAKTAMAWQRFGLVSQLA